MLRTEKCVRLCTSLSMRVLPRCTKALQLRVGDMGQFCKLSEGGKACCGLCMSQLNLAAGAYHRILKLASSIVDLAGSEEIQSMHLVETLQLCPKLMLG